MPNDVTIDHELDVLSQIHLNDGVKQRDIAHVIGLSLGMTNAILKRLAGKGLITMRRINARNIHYLVTPSGIEAIARRSYRYLRRTVGHVVRYKERLLEILTHAAAEPPAGLGRTSVVLVGESDLEFLVEWCATKVGLSFRKESGGPRSFAGRPADFVVMSETMPGEAGGGSRTVRAESSRRWDLHLSELVMPVGQVSP